jgi:pyochelin biosynthetic protein PchC
VTSVAVDRDLWIKTYHPATAGAVQLICFPHAGGSANYFYRLSELLAPNVAVSAVQYPGRQNRQNEPRIESIEEMAAAVAGALTGTLQQPYAFFGHSMGAVVAYETARLLHRDAVPGPAHLIASGRRAPSRLRPSENIHLRPDDGVINEIRKLGGTPDVLLDDPDFRELVLGPTRSDYRAIETYVSEPGFQLDCPVTVLIGDRDSHTTSDEAEAWAEHSAAACDVHVFPGGHFFVNEQRAGVADVIRDTLARL